PTHRSAAGDQNGIGVDSSKSGHLKLELRDQSRLRLKRAHPHEARRNDSRAIQSMHRVSVLVTNDKDQGTLIRRSIDQRVREAPKGQRTATLRGRRANGRIRGNQLRNSLDFVHETDGDGSPRLPPVEVQRRDEIVLSAGMKALAHPSLARRRAMVSGPASGVSRVAAT
ncbi:MAG: hypothetical protein WBM40_01605, partial [Thiohalocapsa sp.]